MQENSKPDNRYPFLTSPHLYWRLAFIAMLLTLPSSFIGFQLDDFMHRTRLLYSWGRFDTGLQMFGLFHFLPKNPDFVKLAMNYGIPWWSSEEMRIMERFDSYEAINPQTKAWITMKARWYGKSPNMVHAGIKAAYARRNRVKR